MVTVIGVCGAGSLLWAASHSPPSAEITELKKGYSVRATGLKPLYPEAYNCSPLTSLYASWTDIDGSRRDEIHSGVDGGRLGERILAPAAGTIRAVWKSNWKWGWEGSLLLLHTQEDVNLDDGAPFYYSAFDHLSYDDIKILKVGQKVRRGQSLARVNRPGGQAIYLPEVHWEVWEAQKDELVWKMNRYNAPTWSNKSAKLIDPLYMLGLNNPPSDEVSVEITPFIRNKNYKDFLGFSYILPCQKK